ncbi:hypothetical protein ABZT48_34450 [Streptomyces avermitilis]|uniref:hypothetical protein n=1 Tax=Streptomyces avermitilis TaxID=33903 RepID=UPI0033BAE0F0
MVDVNIKGVLYGIDAALPVLREQGFGQFVSPGFVRTNSVESMSNPSTTRTCELNSANPAMSSQCRRTGSPAPSRSRSSSLPKST